MNKTRARLILLTLLIIFIGSVVAVIISLDNLTQKDCPNQDCDCAQGCECIDNELVCKESTQLPDDVEILTSPDREPVTPLEESKFDFLGMVFRTHYLTQNIDDEFNDASAGVVLDEVEYTEGQISVVLREKTICNNDDEIKLHEGLYYFDGTKLILGTNLVNDGLDYPNSCIAELVYDISGINIEEFTDFRMFYQNDAGALQEFMICPYSDQIYVNGDAFQAVDNCNACSCEKGVVTCSTEKKCIESEKGDSAYHGRPDYDLFEQPESENECSSDKQCYATGCQDEVCSPVNGVVSDCGVALSKIDGASCGCVNKKCVWSSD
ncbi:hypothetical protein GF357_04180 [Candidatus Dojkabacteria bacterium]|nr:hypothetical protein [Candidatus Dojkabacteria bacterium]